MRSSNWPGASPSAARPPRSRLNSKVCGAAPKRPGRAASTQAMLEIDIRLAVELAKLEMSLGRA